MKTGTYYSILAGIVMLPLLFCYPIKADNSSSRHDAAQQCVGIEHYVLCAGPLKIGNFLDNASGLAFNPLTQSLFLVFNRPEKIIELGLDGAKKRIISLQGFQDTEGITHIRDNTYAVVEEKRRTICIIEIDGNTTSLERREGIIVMVDPDPDDNTGLEGVSYDRKNGLFYVVKEKEPGKIYKIPWTDAENYLPENIHSWDTQQKSLLIKDLSGIYYHSGSGNLLVLSDESACVVEMTADGKELGRLSLKKDGKSSLQKDIPQAEGITMDDQGILFVCSEPDLLYIFNLPIR